jgi:hypothetical protein
LFPVADQATPYTFVASCFWTPLQQPPVRINVFRDLKKTQAL